MSIATPFMWNLILRKLFYPVKCRRRYVIHARGLCPLDSKVQSSDV